MKSFVAIIWLLTLGCWGFMLLMTHGTPDEVRQMPSLGLTDTLDHLLAFGLLGGLLSMSIWGLFPKRPLLLALGLPLLLAYAALDEKTRSMTTPHAQIRHWLADAAGAAVAVTCMYVFCGLSSVLPRSVRPAQPAGGRVPPGRGASHLGPEVESALASYSDSNSEAGDHIIRVEKTSDPSPTSTPVRATARRAR